MSQVNRKKGKQTEWSCQQSLPYPFAHVGPKPQFYLKSLPIVSSSNGSPHPGPSLFLTPISPTSRTLPYTSFRKPQSILSTLSQPSWTPLLSPTSKPAYFQPQSNHTAPLSLTFTVPPSPPGYNSDSLAGPWRLYLSKFIYSHSSNMPSIKPCSIWTMPFTSPWFALSSLHLDCPFPFLSGPHWEPHQNSGT